MASGKLSTSNIANPTYTPLPVSSTGYQSFASFYPYYLGEHNHKICRRLHLIGTGVSSLILTRVLFSYLPVPELKLGAATWKYVVGAIAQGYAFAWVGHFFFEKNKPATFSHPLYSFQGDLKLFWEVITRKRAA